MTLAAGAAASSRASAASGDDIYHVAIFRFAKENTDDAMAAFRALASAARQQSGNLSYDIYRGIDDDLEFYVVEHWASTAALATHERTHSLWPGRAGEPRDASRCGDGASVCVRKAASRRALLRPSLHV